MWITIPDKEENYQFDKIEIGELFIDHSNKNESGEEQVYMKTERIAEREIDINAINLHTGELFFFYPEDTVEPITASININRGVNTYE